MQHLAIRQLIILGAGGFAREVACWALHSGRCIVAFYDELRDMEGSLYGIPIISNLRPYAGMDFIVAVGDPGLRSKMWAAAITAGLNPGEAVIHPTALQGENVKIGAGSILCPYTIITCDAKIGSGVIINLAATIGHDSELGAFVTVSPGANISGNVKIGAMSYIGTNAAIREKITIGSRTTIGMGSVVVKNISDNCTAIGNPARERIGSVISIKGDL